MNSVLIGEKGDHKEEEKRGSEQKGEQKSRKDKKRRESGKMRTVFSVVAGQFVCALCVSSSEAPSLAFPFQAGAVKLVSMETQLKRACMCSLVHVNPL